MPAVNVIKRKAKPYVITRPGAEALVDGISTPAAGSNIDIEAVIQQMTAKELRNLPPGQNSGEWITIWSETLMKLRDQVTYGSILYTIQRVAYWEDGPFYIANANRTEDVLP